MQSPSWWQTVSNYNPLVLQLLYAITVYIAITFTYGKIYTSESLGSHTIKTLAPLYVSDPFK
jgi:hypothetical protein